jgi:hypothetical protein
MVSLEDVRLTGRYRFRRSWRGKMMLQVEEQGYYRHSVSLARRSEPTRWWRDAQWSDVVELGLCRGEIPIVSKPWDSIAADLRRVIADLSACVDALEGRDGVDVATELAVACSRLEEINERIGLVRQDEVE